MFRKSYKEAMNDIKPDAAFVESVIAASKKRRPPLRPRFVKYAPAIAAAVVVVSGAVLSMPLWNRVQDSGDGVISEVTATETAKPSEAEEPQQTADKAAEVNTKTTPAPVGGEESKKSSSASSSNKTAVQKASIPSKSEQTDAVNEVPEQAESNDAAEDITDSADSGEVQIMRSVVMGDSEAEVRENSAPADMAPYESKAEVYSAKSAAQPEITDADIPTPAGYRCMSATPRGYTFVNDEGAVITVTINYGGEEREPYIEEDGDNIYAVFTSFGLSVTINASGAERESVEEIINSLR